MKMRMHGWIRGLLVGGLLCGAAPLVAQPPFANSFSAIVTFSTIDPAGACSNGRYWWNTTSDHQWICDNGTWLDLTTTAFTGGTITTPILGPTGDCAAPNYSWTGDTNSGLCQISADYVIVQTRNFGGSTVNLAALQLREGTRSALFYHGAAGTANSFSAEDNLLQMSTGGVTRSTINTAAFSSTLPFLAPNGTRALPGHSFTTEPDSGLYVVAAGEIGLSVNDIIGYSFAPGSVGHRFYAGNVETFRINATNGFELLSTVSQMVSSGAALGSPDVGLARLSAGNLRVSNGAAGNGSITAFNHTVLLSGQLLFHTDVQVQRGVAGNLQVLNAGTIGNLNVGYRVIPNTATTAPTETISATLYTNTGDADGSIINLPNDPTIGTQFRVALTVAQTVTINAATGETIAIAGQTAGTVISSSTLYGTLHLVAVTGGSGAVWMVQSHEGTWTVT